MSSKTSAVLCGTAVFALSAIGGPARAQTSASRLVVTPESSLAHAGDAGRRAHTNVKFIQREAGVTPASEPFNGNFYETPASLACMYGLVAKTTGCNPDTLSKTASGGSTVVAIVDAYDDPTALSDLQKYSTQFGLPAVSSSNFQVVYAAGTRPSYNSGWQLEEALDVQMVHALAPKAKIILVEAASNSFNDLFAAEKVAARLVTAAGGGEVSNSWGSSEFSAETTSAYTSPFTGSSVVFFASTGDSDTPSFPAVLPGVVAVGGTSVARNPSTGDFSREVTWTDAGAGPSRYVPRPSFQSAVSGVVGTTRGVPEIALDANPNTGVWVYIAPYWYIVGGTSASSPMAAAITNAAGHFANSTTTELNAIYANARSAPSDFHDINFGACGSHEFYAAGTGFDRCVGNGSPANLAGE